MGKTFLSYFSTTEKNLRQVGGNICRYKCTTMEIKRIARPRERFSFRDFQVVIAQKVHVLKEIFLP